MKKNKLVGGFVIGTFVMLYILVSLISTIHVIDFFELSNPRSMAIALAIAFEIGAAASLASLVTLDKMNKTLVWALFIAITAMQMQGNMYYAFMNLESYETWSELFNLIEEEPLYQKRILAFVSGAILPLVALGFIKSLVDYIKPEDEKVIEEAPGKQSNPEEDLFDWDGFAEEDSEEPFVEEDFVTDELLNQEFDNDDIQNYQEMKSNDREKFVEEIDPEEEWDEEHALDQVMNDMVKDFPDLDTESNDSEDLVNSKESNKDNLSEKDIEASYQFGKNLYQTMVNKTNTDHLQIDTKPSKEEISKAYRNLGLVKKNK